MNIPQAKRVSANIAGVEIALETGKYAKQASGSVVVTAGESKVLCTATAGDVRDVDFLPLTVDVEERMYAAGKIPGSFFKREGRPSEKGILTARMIDRPLRPLFPKGWRYETQIVAIPMCIDHQNSHDILAMNGASAALAVSHIPFPTLVGAVRIALIEGEFIVNPAEADVPEASLDLIVSGSDEAILMVEAGAREVTEQEILDALDIAHAEIKTLVGLQRQLAEIAGKEKLVVEEPQVDERLYGAIEESHGARIDEATQVEEKLARQSAVDEVEADVMERYCPPPPDDETEPENDPAEVERAFAKLEKDVIRRRIAVDKRRPDGRCTDELRSIWIETGVSPRAHGSAIFTRGETQALTTAALGTTREEMRVDDLSLTKTKSYIHHYNFPPFSVGEASFMRGPKRRDIGHGALAERALLPMIPSVEEFPYTIRVVSDILESNGSSSMASVCGSSLALMDAGVKVARPVAGVAMGLIKEGEEHVVLTDIAGVEDHLGDMDFKVAGTENGITALQMDIKITGVTFEILGQALEQARQGRMAILAAMKEAIDGPRAELSPYAPRITAMKIDPDKIGALIGKGGETIRGLCDEFEAEIDVQDDGTVRLYVVDGELGDALMERIVSLTKDVEIGDTFLGKVVKTTEFGAFVELAKGTDGLLHISNIAPGEGRPERVEDVVNRGDQLDVRVVSVDKVRGKIGLRRSDDPAIAGKSPDELAAIGTGGNSGGGRRGGPGGGGRGGDGGRRPRRRRD